jgi:capsid portal protein
MIVPLKISYTWATWDFQLPPVIAGGYMQWDTKKSKNVSRKSQGDETVFQPIRRCGKQKT